MNRKISLILTLLMATSFFVNTIVSSKEELDKNKPNEIVFGQTAFLSKGSLQLYGELIRDSINARFARVNKKGGIKNKKLRLVSMDDKGEPEISEKNIKSMLAKKIDMFLGNTGTRSILQVLPLIEKKNIAMLFPWAGSDKLRQPHLSNIINGVGLTKPQISKIVSYVVETLRIKKIAIFHDDGSFGLENKKMVIEELEKYNVTPIETASYNRFTLDIDTPAKKLIASDPKTVICLGTSMPAAKMINKFMSKGHYGTKFIGIDSTMFVGKILKRKGVKFYYSSPFPHPEKKEIKIVKEFLEDMRKTCPHNPPNILSLAYYIHAVIIEKAIENIEGNVTKGKLISEIEKIKNLDIGGFTVNFNSMNRHAYPHNISIIEG